MILFSTQAIEKSRHIPLIDYILNVVSLFVLECVFSEIVLYSVSRLSSYLTSLRQSLTTMIT